MRLTECIEGCQNRPYKRQVLDNAEVGFVSCRSDFDDRANAFLRYMTRRNGRTQSAASDGL